MKVATVMFSAVHDTISPTSELDKIKEQLPNVIHTRSNQ
jgi:hypothetical protein